MPVCLPGSTPLIISGAIGYFALLNPASVRESDTGSILSRKKKSRAPEGEPPGVGTDGWRSELGMDVVPAIGREDVIPEDGVL